MPEAEPLPEGEAVKADVARSKVACADAVYLPAGTDADPGVVPDPVLPAIGGLLTAVLPYDVEVGANVDCPWGSLLLLRNRTASMPSANAPPAKAIGCRRANPSTSAIS
jgi:hypothetical protein